MNPWRIIFWLVVFWPYAVYLIFKIPQPVVENSEPGRRDGGSFAPLFFAIMIGLVALVLFGVERL